jgi:hypothetical protein
MVTAVFVELPAFERHRANYLDDEGFLETSAVADAKSRTWSCNTRNRSIAQASFRVRTDVEKANVVVCA